MGLRVLEYEYYLNVLNISLPYKLAPYIGTLMS